MTTRAFHVLKWLYPGMRVKRWLVFTVVGIAFVVAGLALFTNIQGWDFISLLNANAEYIADHFHVDPSQQSFYVPAGATLILLGIGVIFLSFFQVVRSIVGAIWPEGKSANRRFGGEDLPAPDIGAGLEISS